MAEWPNAAACPVEKRWVGGAVERTGLENRSIRKGTAGSNPAPTAFLRGREKPLDPKRASGVRSPHSPPVRKCLCWLALCAPGGNNAY